MFLLGVFILMSVGTTLADSVNYYLTNSRVKNFQYSVANAGLWSSLVDSSCDAVFLVHGWMGLAYPTPGTPLQSTVDAYAALPPAQGCYNVVRVFWDAASSQDYYYSAQAVVPTGVTIGDFVSGLNLTGGRVDCTGHSLGAHVCGNAGRRLRYLGGILFEVVTGLDPAGPAFTSATFPVDMSASKLSATDGVVVVTLMTNAGFLGTDQQLGDVNFLANGGSAQPGCSTIDEPCCHSRAVQLNDEAVAHDWFVGSSSAGRTGVFGRSMPLVIAYDAYGFTTRGGSLYGGPGP